MSQLTLRRWEFKPVRPARDETTKEAGHPEAAVTICREDGWELVTTSEYTGDGTRHPVLNRPLELAAPTETE